MKNVDVAVDECSDVDDEGWKKTRFDVNPVYAACMQRKKLTYVGKSFGCILLQGPCN